MPFLDLFRPPLSQRRHWTNLHSAWANAIRNELNGGLLPPRYFAEVEVKLGDRIEVDVATFEEGGRTAPATEEGGGVALWAPPRPAATVPLSFSDPDLFEVRVLTDQEGPQVVATIELISPANKDRPSHRHIFAVKCASLLQQGVGLVLVDVVTDSSGDLHSELLEVLRATAGRSPSDLYAGAYRTVPSRGDTTLEYWLEDLALGTSLPTMPLWIAPDRCVPLNLEQTYRTACAWSRID